MARPDEGPLLLEVGSGAEWRAWLSANHASSDGVRLAIGKKGTDATALFYENAVEEAVCFGWIDSKTQRLDSERYTVVMTPRKPGSIWAASNKARVTRMIAQGRMTAAGLSAVERAKSDGSWTLLDDIDALVIPDDLLAALARQPGAEDGFSALSVSRRKQLLYWIATAKRPATRARRIAEIVTEAAGDRPSA